MSSLKSSQKGFEGGFGSSGADKLELSKKSVVVASSKKLAEEIQHRIQDEGIRVTAKSVAADLGIERGHGRKHKIKHKKRCIAAWKQLKN